MRSIPQPASHAFVYCLLLITAVGCTSTPHAPASAQWPATWDGRQAFDTKSATVYARNDAVVNEIDKLVSRVEREFVQKTGGQPTRGLIIVNDIEDAQVGKLPVEQIPPSNLIPKEIMEMDISRQEMLLAAPIELKGEQLTSPLGFSEEAARSVSWAVAVPSERRVRQVAKRLLDSTMQDPSLTLAERTMLVSFLPLFANCVSDTIGSARDVMIYKQFCDTQPTWDDARRKKEFESYKTERTPAGAMPFAD